MIAFIKLNHLRNGEFIQFISNTIDLIEVRGAETLQIVPQLNALKEKLAGMEPHFNRDQKNPVTREVVRQDQRRRKSDGQSGPFATITTPTFHERPISSIFI